MPTQGGGGALTYFFRATFWDIFIGCIDVPEVGIDRKCLYLALFILKLAKFYLTDVPEKQSMVHTYLPSTCTVGPRTSRFKRSRYKISYFRFHIFDLASRP